MIFESGFCDCRSRCFDYFFNKNRANVFCVVVERRPRIVRGFYEKAFIFMGKHFFACDLFLQRNDFF